MVSKVVVTNSLEGFHARELRQRVGHRKRLELLQRAAQLADDEARVALGETIGEDRVEARSRRVAGIPARRELPRQPTLQRLSGLASGHGDELVPHDGDEIAVFREAQNVLPEPVRVRDDAPPWVHFIPSASPGEDGPRRRRTAGPAYSVRLR